MLYKKLKDNNFRKKLKKLESKQIVLKYVLMKLLTGEKYIQNPAIIKFNAFSKTKIRRRCILTNRSRGVYTKYNISRVKLRELLQFGLIPGYKKSV